MTHLKLFVVTILCSTLSFAQIKPNEKLVYAASYNMGGLLTQLAQVTMETEKMSTSKKDFLHLSCQASTFSKWDSFFKIRDLYESYVDPITLRPSLYKRSILEGNYTKVEKYIFKPDGKTVMTTARIMKRPETQKTMTIGNATQDAISILYKMRTVDFSKLKVGQAKVFTIFFDEKEYPVTFKMMGKETIKAGNLGEKECYILSIAAKTKALKGKDKNLIWITTDGKRIPAQIKFSITVGTGQLTLSNATGI